MRRVVSSLAAIGILLLPVPALAVDGVREINASSASGGPGPLYTITAPGSYRLTSDLSVPAGRIGINITADDVTLDLKRFTVRGSGSEGIRVLGAGGLAWGNTIRGSALQGLTINAGSGYGANVITGNNGGGAQVGGGGVAVACNLIGLATVCA
jgi:hypothetical protein